MVGGGDWRRVENWDNGESGLTIFWCKTALSTDLTSPSEMGEMRSSCDVSVDIVGAN